MLKEVSFGNDGTISKEKLISCINSDLANNYGNLCQRVISFVERNLNLAVPKNIKLLEEDFKILNIYNDNYEKLLSSIDKQEINTYVNFIQSRLFNANKYFNDQEPWKKKDNKLRLNTIIYTSLELIRKISILLYPIIPDTSLKVLNIFKLNEKNINFKTIINHDFLDQIDNIISIKILFKKIDND